MLPVQGYLACKKQRHPMTLHKDYAEGSAVAPGGWVLSSDQGTHAGLP